MGRRRRSLLHNRRRPTEGVVDEHATDNPSIADEIHETDEQLHSEITEENPVDSVDPPDDSATIPPIPRMDPIADPPRHRTPDPGPLPADIEPPAPGVSSGTPLEQAYPVSDFDDVAPPTEEVPNAVLQDISQPYSAPMHVPEPPPIPGILDRFTPAGAAPRSRRNKIERRPSYIAATPTPPPMLRRLEEMEPEAVAQGVLDEDEDEEPETGALPVVLGLLAVVLLIFLVLGGVIVSGILNNQGGDPVVEPVHVQPVPAPVVEPEPEPEPEELAPDPDEQPPDPEPVNEVEPVGVPVVPASPRPVRPRPVRTTPVPVPEPDPVPEPIAERGTVKITSNRRVMVYIGGKAVGFTPRSYRAQAGEVSISAMLPRQPQSKQVQVITVVGGEKQKVAFTF